MKFKELLKNESVLKVIDELKYETATEIQEKIIPLILGGSDVLGQSKTGTGKTLAFIAPILERIVEDKSLQTLIIAPTRELALQIAKETEILSKYTDINITCVYGKSSIEDQIKKLKKGSEIVIGTPGRIKDLIKRGKLILKDIKYFVLDEADEMLSMGFQDELEFIFKEINDSQVLLFSATMPKSILSIAKKYMSSDYKTVTVINEEKTADNIEQHYYVINDSIRLEAICRIIDFYNVKKAIIFCKTKHNADDVSEKLTLKGYSIGVIHGDITQTQRITTLEKFKKGQFNYLIATDVAARGIHVEDVDIVINFNLPESKEAYVHRIGRTGRANKSGLAITFIKSNEERVLKEIEKYINKKLIKKELPSKEEILPNHLERLINRLNSIKSISKENVFEEYLNTLNENEKNNILSNLLNKELMNDLGSDFEKSIDVKSNKKDKEKHRSKNNSNETRIFLTIGKMDKVDKKELLSFIEKTANVPEGTCTSTDILTKFTFMSVNNKYLDKVLKSCNNIKYNSRIIRIEIAKN